MPYWQNSTSVLLALFFATLMVSLIFILLYQLLNAPGVQSGSFWQLFVDPFLIKTLIFTLLQASLSTIISVSVGFILAWSLAAQTDFPFRKGLVVLISTALVLPTLVVVLGLVSVYGRNGWLSGFLEFFGVQNMPFSIYGLVGILIAHTFFNSSFAARVFLLRLESIPDEKRKLSISLNLGLWRSLRCIEFPAISPVLPSLMVTIFLLCFTSFAIVLTLGGLPTFNTLEVAIFEAVRFEFDLNKAFQLSVVQLAVCAVLVLSIGNITGSQMVRFSKPGKMHIHQFQNAGLNTFQWAIIVGFAIFFLMPLFAVVIDGIGSQLINLFSSAVFWQTLTISLTIAITSTIMVLVVASIIAHALSKLSTDLNWKNRRITGLLSAILSFSGTVYLVFPALVMGLGFFLLYLKIGGDAYWWAGTIVVLANALIAMPFAIASLQPAYTKCALSHDRLSNALGLSNLRRFLIVDWPMLKRDYYYVTAMAFSFSLGDLGVIALFGSDEFKTLPWLLYQKFGSYQTQEASAISLVLLVLVTGVFLLSGWLSRNAQLPGESHANT